MNVTQTSLLFFYGIFWAASLNAINVLKPFPTHQLFKKETKHTARKRIAVSVVVANVLPITGVWLLYGSHPMTITTSTGILFSACVSLSLFSIIRILQGIMLNKCSRNYFYTPKEIQEFKDEKDESKNPDDPWHHHIVPGLAYIVLFVGIPFLVYYSLLLVSFLKSIEWFKCTV